MFKKVLGIFAIVTLLVSCGTQQKKEKECTEKATITVDNLLAEITNYIDKDIVVVGIVNHVCEHGGKRMFIMGEDPDVAIKITPNDEIGIFEKELEGNHVIITGIVKELRIDEAYVANLEKELSEGADNEAIHDHSGEEEKEEPARPAGEHAETEVDSSKIKQIEHMKTQIAESENGYYSQFWVEASKFEVKECDHDHEDVEGDDHHDHAEGEEHDHEHEHVEGEEHTH
ncbi:MAG: hypothetical protein KAQ75_04930 [Bacteroidales bacterium]|nr:hypothetical protein [Bacteroidales bacterium]